MESEGCFSTLSTFDVPVDTGTQNFLNALSACLSYLSSIAEITFLNSYMLLSLVAINDIINTSVILS